MSDAEQFRARLAGLGLSQSAFARVSRTPIRTVQSWTLGDRAIPGIAWALLDHLAGGDAAPPPAGLTDRDRALLLAFGLAPAHQDRALETLSGLERKAQMKTLARLRRHGLVEPAGNVAGWYRWTAAGRIVAQETPAPAAAAARAVKAAGTRYPPAVDARIIALRCEGRPAAAIAARLTAEGGGEAYTAAQVRTRLRDLAAAGRAVPQIRPRWSPEADAELDRLTAEGLPDAEIGRRLGRTAAAVEQRRLYRSGRKRA